MNYQRSTEISFCMVSIILVASAISGCATTGGKAENVRESKVEETLSEHKEAAIGATLLGLLGAGVGYALAGEKGAAIGGGAGLALGTGIGQMFKHKDKERTEAVSEAAFRPDSDDQEQSIVAHPDSDDNVLVVADASNPAPDVRTRSIRKPADDIGKLHATYEIYKDGQRLGTIENPEFDAPSLGHLLLCKENALESCVELDLRPR